MRRKDRETSEGFALELIDKCQYAVLATVNKDGTPYCIPISIVREDKAVYFHSAKEGQKLSNMKDNPSVCLTCVGAADIIEEKLTVAYESAVIFGTAKEVEADQEKLHALRILCQKLTPNGMDGFDDAIRRSLAHTSVWRVDIKEITGKSSRKD